MEISKLLETKSVPGESLTNPQGQMPWENPNNLVGQGNPVEVFGQLMETYYQEENHNNIMKLIFSGVPIELIAKSTFMALFTEGKVTVDTAELLKPAFIINMIADARDTGIEDFKVFEEVEDNSLDFGSVMSVNNPEKFDDISRDLERDELEEINEEGSFLDV